MKMRIAAGPREKWPQKGFFSFDLKMTRDAADHQLGWHLQQWRQCIFPAADLLIGIKRYNLDQKCKKGDYCMQKCKRKEKLQCFKGQDQNYNIYNKRARISMLGRIRSKFK